VRVASLGDINEVVQLSHHQIKWIFIMIFTGIRKFLLNALPNGQVRNPIYFIEEVAGVMEAFSYSKGRNPHEKYITFHFNNAPIHNSANMKEKIALSGFTRMKHLFYDPNPADGNFILFDYIKENLKGSEFGMPTNSVPLFAGF
jgi:hypothetical protein